MADELLKALGQLQRRQQAERTRDGPDPPTLDATDQASILAAVLGDAPPAAIVKASEPGGATVVPLTRARTRRGWLAGIGSLAAAAALFLVLRTGDGDAGIALPAYDLVQAGGEASVRGSQPTSTGPLILRADTAIDWRLAPVRAAEGPVGLRLIASQAEDRRWIAVDPALAVSADGVLRLRGRAGAWLGLPPGVWTLTFVIARPDQLPIDLPAFVQGRDRSAERGWQLQQVQVQIED